MSNKHKQKIKKEKIPLSKDKKKELIYIGTIIALITVIIVMFALKFPLSTNVKEEDKPMLDDTYYVAVDPYEIPNRTEEETKNQYENEIIVHDVWYRLNLPFPITTNTITNEFADKITELTGISKYIGYVNSISYATSINPGIIEHDADGNQILYDVEPTPFVLMIINCRDKDSVGDITSEIESVFFKNWFGEDSPLDDVIIHSSNGNKITICAMNSSAKKKIGVAAIDVMHNLDYYLLTYDGRYKDQQPPIYSESAK